MNFHVLYFSKMNIRKREHVSFIILPGRCLLDCWPIFSDPQMDSPCCCSLESATNDKHLHCAGLLPWIFVCSAQRLCNWEIQANCITKEYQINESDQSWEESLCNLHSVVFHKCMSATDWKNLSSSLTTEFEKQKCKLVFYEWRRKRAEAWRDWADVTGLGD